MIEIKIEAASAAEARAEMIALLNGEGPASDTVKTTGSTTSRKTQTKKEEPAKDEELSIETLREAAAAAKERTGASLAPVLAKFKVTKLSDIKVSDYPKAMAAFEAFEAPTDDDID